MGKFSDLLFGGKKGRGTGADAAGSATPMVVDIVVPGRPGAAGAKDAGGFGAHEAEGGLEASASLGSLHELTLADSSATVSGAGSVSGTPSKPAPRPSAWQRMRHNNSLGGLNPISLMRGKSKASTLSKVAATNAAAAAAATAASSSSESSSAATGGAGGRPDDGNASGVPSPAPTSRNSAAAGTATPPPAASAGIVVSITSPSNGPSCLLPSHCARPGPRQYAHRVGWRHTESLALSGAGGGSKSAAAATPIGGKPKASNTKTNATPLQLPGDRAPAAVGISTGSGGGSPKSPNSGSTATAAAAAGGDTDSQHADILRRRRVELFSVLLGSHDLLPEFSAKYELISDLGVGAFGFVISARDRAGGKEVAVKFISKESVPRTSLLYDDRLGMIPSEIFVLRRLKHPHILGYIESFGDAKYYYMVTELHGDIWGIEKDPVYTYRPLNASGLNSTGSPGSSLTSSSREGMSVHSATSGDRFPPSSPAAESTTGKRKGSKGERVDSPRDSVGTASSSGASSTATAGSTLSPPPSTRGKKAGKVRQSVAPTVCTNAHTQLTTECNGGWRAHDDRQTNKRSTGSASSTLNHVMQLLKTKVENMDGRRHTVSLPPARSTAESPPRRSRKLSDPLWGRFQPSTSTRPHPQASLLSVLIGSIIYHVHSATRLLAGPL
jgi:hypothetical protein